VQNTSQGLGLGFSNGLFFGKTKMPYTPDGIR